MDSDSTQKNLIVLSASYPYGKLEVFLENELPFLVERFGHIFLLPMFAYGAPRHLHPGITLLPSAPPSQWPPLEFIRGIHSSGGMLLPEWHKAPGFPLSPYQLYLASRTLGIARRIQRRIQETVEENKLDNGIIYSYWMNQASIGGILAARNLKWSVVARAHGGDLYTERYATNYLPWHEWKVRNMNYVFPVSRYGQNYLMERYPECAGKIRHMKLGVGEPLRETAPASASDSTSAAESKEPSFHIASCSSIIPLKRVEHILDTVLELKELLPDLDIRWTHIGTGPLFSSLLNQAETASRKGLKIDLKGHLPNSEVKHFFSVGDIDLFINYSTSEGLPVSIMEAFSCGIPAVAPDVGGISEIVDERCGLLFDPDSAPQTLAQQIRDLYRSGRLSAMSVSAIEKWGDEFRLETNYQAFSEFLYREV